MRAKAKTTVPITSVPVNAKPPLLAWVPEEAVSDASVVTAGWEEDEHAGLVAPVLLPDRHGSVVDVVPCVPYGVDAATTLCAVAGATTKPSMVMLKPTIMAAAAARRFIILPHFNLFR